jgi:hypothetical protein
MTTVLTKPGSSAVSRRSISSVAIGDWTGSSWAK